MKILSYNLYGVIWCSSPTPPFQVRLKNLERTLDSLFQDEEIKVCCFQEVNENNFPCLKEILTNHEFIIGDLYPMITGNVLQYNVVAYRKDLISPRIFCLPHGTDSHYVSPKKQVKDYGMSDYRTTIFLHFLYHGKTYCIGNIHTDYISIEGKLKGCLKSLDYLDRENADFKLLVGDMNMISHMAEVYQIILKKPHYTTLSKSHHFQMDDLSYHGYGKQEPVNVDYAFLPKSQKLTCEYTIIKQENLSLEASDHRPVIITIFDK